MRKVSSGLVLTLWGAQCPFFLGLVGEAEWKDGLGITWPDKEGIESMGGSGLQVKTLL